MTTHREPVERLSPHEENYRVAVARALESERQYARLVAAADARVHRAVKIISGAIVFCVTWTLLTLAPLAFDRPINIFFTLALNLGLWAFGALCTRTARRPR